jgi:hypothetical protein
MPRLRRPSECFATPTVFELVFLRMGAPRWIYLLLIVVGAAVGLAIAGLPSQHYDPPLRIAPTTTTAVGTPPPQG